MHRVGLDAESEHVGIVLAGRSDRIQLRRRDDEQASRVDGSSVRTQWSVIARTS